MNCIYPSREDYEELPEGSEEWRTSDTCKHEHCVEVAGFARAYEAHRRTQLTDDERDEILSDRELILDEYHGVFID